MGTVRNRQRAVKFLASDDAPTSTASVGREWRKCTCKTQAAHRDGPPKGPSALPIRQTRPGTPGVTGRRPPANIQDAAKIARDFMSSTAGIYNLVYSNCVSGRNTMGKRSWGNTFPRRS